MVQTFRVEGMSCGHCERAVTRAVREVDPLAAVQVDLAGGTVGVESAADAARLVQAIAAEGYAVRPLG